MSLHGLMRDTFGVYARTPESDTQVWQANVAGTVEALNASGARRESPLLEPDVTHSGRFAYSAELVAGRRVRRVSDGAEWTIKVVRERGRGVKHCHCLMAEAAGAI